MTDADRFLATIIAAPDDDVPRLVFADWLEEHGDVDRAEFIRLQIAEAQTQIPGSPRTRELLERNRKRWLIPGIPGSQVFRRGFVEYLHISADDFLQHEAEIETAAPVVGLRLSVAAGRTSALVRVGWLSRLRSLDILNDGMGPRLREWFRPGAFPSLRSLGLRNNRLWSDYVAILVELAPYLPKLERLDLSGNPLGNEGLGHIAKGFSGLSELVLASDDVDEEYRIGLDGVAAFARSTTLRLRSLILDNQRLGDDGFLSLIQSPTGESLVKLDVSRNGIGERTAEWVEALIDSSRLPRLQSLVFRGNAITPDGIAIRRWDRLQAGCIIDLRGCRIGPQVRRILKNSDTANQILLEDEEAA